MANPKVEDELETLALLARSAASSPREDVIASLEQVERIADSDALVWEAEKMLNTVQLHGGCVASARSCVESIEALA